MVHATYTREREQWWREYLEQAIIGPPWEPIVLILLNDGRIAKSVVPHTPPPSWLEKYQFFMVVCLIRDEYNQPFCTKNRAKKILVGRSGLFHKVDWGRTSSKNHCSTSKKICLEGYSMLIRHSTHYYNRRWETIYGLKAFWVL